MAKSNIIKLNVGGVDFRIRLSTLESLGETKLLSFVNSERNSLSGNDVIYLDRSPDYFKPILDLYRSKHLHFPPGLCWFRLREEAEFWDFNPHDYMPICCSSQVNAIEDKEDIVKILDKQLDQSHFFADLNKSRECTSGCLLERIKHRGYKIWLFLEYPMSSRLATVWGLFFLFVVLTAVFLKVASSIPSCRILRDEPLWNTSSDNNTKRKMLSTTHSSWAIWWLEIVCLAVFIVEVTVRLATCPCKVTFIKSIYTIIDLISIIPSFGLIIMEDLLFRNKFRGFVYILNIMSIFRVLRLFKFLRHFLCVRVLYLALKCSIKEISLLLTLLAVGTLFFSYLIYFAEIDTDDQFATIPVGFWWAIITMTTVGYGDTHPQTVFGYIIGAVCAVFGMIMIGIPIPAISNNFSLIYNLAQSKSSCYNWKKIQDSANAEQVHAKCTDYKLKEIEDYKLKEIEDHEM